MFELGAILRGLMRDTKHNIKDSASSVFDVIKQYSVGEEIASSVLHGLGVIFGIAGLAVMLVFAGLGGDGYKIAASIIYGISIILEYTASTLYHSLTNERAKYILKCSITRPFICLLQEPTRLIV